jgi:hypothetical protein
MAAEIMAGVEETVGKIHGGLAESDPQTLDKLPSQHHLPPEESEGEEDLEHQEGAEAQDAEESTGETQDAEAQDAEESTGETQEPSAFGSLSNSGVERAVRLGVPLEEIKQYPNDGLLAAMCSRIEAQGGVTGSQAGAGEGESSGGDGHQSDDPLSAIPTLSKDEYDDEIVDAVEGMKGVIRKLMGENAELRGGRSKDWFSTKLDGVKHLTKGDPDKVSSLKDKFDVLKAGYGAAGKSVPDEAIFSEASKLVLGDEMVAAEKSKKSNMARRRNGQFMSRATNRRIEVKGDPITEVAAMVDQRIYGGA